MEDCCLAHRAGVIRRRMSAFVAGKREWAAAATGLCGVVVQACLPVLGVVVSEYDRGPGIGRTDSATLAPVLRLGVRRRRGGGAACREANAARCPVARRLFGESRVRPR